MRWWTPKPTSCAAAGRTAATATGMRSFATCVGTLTLRIPKLRTGSFFPDIAIGRLRTDERTKEYVAKKMSEGHTKMEAIRCLKRYIAREVYYVIKRQSELVNCS